MDLRFLVLNALLVLAGCHQSAQVTTTLSEPRASTRAFHVLSSDYLRTGVVEFFAPGSRIPQWRVPVHADSLLRRFAGDSGTWVINRLGADNVQYLTENGHTLYQWSTGRGNNPQDLVPVGENEVWISQFESPELLRMERTSGETLGSIDLRIYADDDLNPEATRMARVAGEVWIQFQALERRNAFRPSGRSAFLKLNMRDPNLRTLHSLHFQNPSTDWKSFGDFVYVGGAGTVAPPGVLDGGIERWSTKLAGGHEIVISEKELGGKLIDFAILNSERGVALVSQGGFSRIQIFSLLSRKVERAYPPSPGFTLVGVLSDGTQNRFYVLDRDLENPRIRSFDAQTGEESTSEALPLNLPPLAAEWGG